jgi:uncharacterized SAM-binding protein YcdF (DUF218 family)
VFLKSLLVSLAVPPFGFVTLAFVAIMLPRGHLRLRRTLVGISVAGLILLGMPVFADRLLDALETDIPITPASTPPPAAIVVLGAEIRRTSAEPPVVVGRLSLERLATAARLQRKTGLPVLTSGGALQKDLPSIADIMAESLRDDFLVPTKWREEQSQTTWENALYSAEILKKEGISSVYVVTHAWHMRRAILSFRGTGITVVPAPTPPDRRNGAILDDFVPRASTWNVSYFALHELIGNIWYAFR